MLLSPPISLAESRCGCPDPGKALLDPPHSGASPHARRRRARACLLWRPPAGIPATCSVVPCVACAAPVQAPGTQGLYDDEFESEFESESEFGDDDKFSGDDDDDDDDHHHHQVSARAAERAPADCAPRGGSHACACPVTVEARAPGGPPALSCGCAEAPRRKGRGMRRLARAVASRRAPSSLTRDTHVPHGSPPGCRTLPFSFLPHTALLPASAPGRRAHAFGT